MHVRLAINMFIVTSNLNLIWFNQFYLQPDYSVELLPWYLDSTGFYHLLAPARRCGSISFGIPRSLWTHRLHSRRSLRSCWWGHRLWGCPATQKGQKTQEEIKQWQFWRCLRTRMRNQDQIRNLRRWAWTTGFVFLLGSCWDCFPDCLLSQKMSSMPRKICPNAFQPCMFSLLKNRLGQLMILISLMALRHHVGVQINLLSSSGKDEEEEE